MIAARKNGVGIVGVAPDVTIVPIKVVGSVDPTDIGGDARFSWVIEALEYAAVIGADVINLSFAIDATDEASVPGNEPLWCWSNPKHRPALRSLERAVRYARSRGALPVASIGNGDAVGDDFVGDDLSADDDCNLLPQETPGVLTAGGLAIDGALSSFSNWGLGVVDVVAPAGEDDPAGTSSSSDPGPACATQKFYLGGVIGTMLLMHPGNAYNCGLGTSFSAPLVSGVAALIVSQFGHVGPDGDVRMAPSAVEDLLLGSAIDIGAPGEDKCYGVGRVDARRAVLGDTSYQSDPNVTGCRH